MRPVMVGRQLRFMEEQRWQISNLFQPYQATSVIPGYNRSTHRFKSSRLVVEGRIIPGSHDAPCARSSRSEALNSLMQSSQTFSSPPNRSPSVESTPPLVAEICSKQLGNQCPQEPSFLTGVLNRDSSTGQNQRTTTFRLSEPGQSPASICKTSSTFSPNKPTNQAR